jgi:peptide/nickel transport system ATP-binding protein
MSAPLLDVEGLCVDIATPRGTLHAVRDVSFRIAPGETLCLVGESGCGKSMTAFALMGLLPRAATRRARRLVFQGEELAGLSAARLGQLRGDRMAMVFQEPMTALNPAYTIGDQLTEVHRRHRRSSRAAARDRASNCSKRWASPRRRSGCANTPTSSRADCASASSSPWR